MREDDFVTHALHVPLQSDTPLMSLQVRRESWRLREASRPMVTLELRRRDTGGVFARASYHRGNDKEERAARNFLAQQDSAWWYNAPHYIGDGLEVVEA
jgi:hypothetical protein